MRTFLVFCLILVSLVAFSQAYTIGVGAQSGGEIREFFLQVYQSAGIEIEFKEYPTSRQIHYFNESELDGIIFVSEDVLNLEIENGTPIGFGDEPLFVYPLFGYVLKERVEELNQPNSLIGLNILYIHGNQHHEEKILKFGGKPYSVIEMENAIKMLIAKRVDVLMTAPMAPNVTIQKLGYDGQIETLARPLAFSSYYHVIGNKLLPLQEKIKNSFLEYHEDFLNLLQR